MREHAYVVYIMTDSRRGVLYVGITSDLQTRAHQHHHGEFSGFTRKHGCKLLVWFETHDDIEAAIRREKARQALEARLEDRLGGGAQSRMGRPGASLQRR